MSQHIVEQENLKYVFGWDQPLMSFFIQVHDLSVDNEEERIKFWLGASPATRMPEVDDLVREFKKLGFDVSLKMQIMLHRDQILGQ